MAFGRIIAKILSFLSPKEHALKEKQSRSMQRHLPKTEKMGVAQKKDAYTAKSTSKSKGSPPAGSSLSARLMSLHASFKGNRRKSAALVMLIVTLIFYKYVIPIYVILIFIAIATSSKLIQDWIPFVVGFDLVLFFTVLSGAAYGWKAALIVGCASSIIGSAIRRVSSQNLDTFIFPAIGYGLIAIAIPYISYTTIYGLGIICTAIYVVIMNFVFAYFRPDLFNHATFTITAILFNYWLFKNLAEPIMYLIA